MPLVSVIIPVYKAEQYIEKCIESFLSQTLRDFELLLVDDGSPDRSGEICESFTTDERVKVFHKQNEGVALTREYGMNKATGEYTIHADPDDWVEKTMLEKLYNKAKQDDADMVICDFYLETNGKVLYQHQKPTTNSTVAKDILRFNIERSLCTKLIKRECYSRYDVHFVKGFNHGEDFLVSMQLCCHPELKISYLPEAFYHYVKIFNENSITKNRENSYNKESFDYDCRYLQVLSKYIDDKEEYDYQEAVNIFRAFSYKVFTSKEFKDNFYSKRKMLYHQMGKMKGGLLYLSSLGLNWLSYPLYKIISNTKKTILNS
ncbi:MAG: glycosyltransferase family 2 protein [Bacteroidales bacterium]|nr:glycosyltransferase family 2 protein [Bacteroidales bacterium]